MHRAQEIPFWKTWLPDKPKRWDFRAGCGFFCVFEARGSRTSLPSTIFRRTLEAKSDKKPT
jgi:hypothetical protein